ncbi:uncharacterized protein LOC103724060 [Phoenix dactylifera]|uniref:Uncharacterized protein LOC103724060 n=1 Tax=Phoenix dactylifera TaxID=42345 RepID=A0A8B9AJT6_PHODC|nr:uncharacterized protein LOC103724060 [Phoenix dactylifera]XP_038986975.1 uncharacterized protein LOC103724060 [Phoenix dactylifera]XP_038986976.1 uncharacterized protein LOC103724060 [Phoenix dactylifera]
MTQLCSSDTHLLLGLLFYDLLSLCSFLASHPLHLAYFLFFFPYLFRLLSFFYPLLLSTSLLLLVLLTISPQLDDPPRGPPGLLRNTCSIVFHLLKAKLESHAPVELLDQLASMVLAPIDDAGPYFQEPVMPACVGAEVFELQFGTKGDFCKPSSVVVSCAVEEIPSKPGLENSQKGELLASNYGIGENPLMDPKENELLVPHSDGTQLTNKVAEDSSTAFEPENSCRMPEPAADSVGGELMRSTSRRRRQSTCRGSDGLQRDNSMRKEKEWKRTLACKLYEERMTYKLCEERTVAEGGEEMDLLWEAYEVNASKDGKLMSNGRKGKKDEQEEEDEGTVGQLCCLQALRLSAGKMNLGVGRPNLVKISKVLKGMAMFKRVGRHSSRKE